MKIDVSNKALSMQKWPIEQKKYKSTYHQKSDLVVRKNGSAPRLTTKRRVNDES